jgi:hypothetical protein
MRVRSRGTGSPNGSGDACTDFFSGESEDYEILILDSITGLNNMNQLKNITIYPNLTSGIITVDMGQTVENAQLNVVDVTGKQVEHLKLNATQVQSIDLTNLSDGIYYVSISTANEVVSNKIVIRK